MATMSETRRIAWSIFWKTALVGMIGGYLAGFVVGAIIGAVSVGFGGLTPNWLLAIQIAGGIAGFIVSFLAFNFFFSRAVGRDLGGRQLELTKTASRQEN